MEYSPDDLDRKLSAAFDGKVVRKDLLHRIKKGTNVPTFVLEFLLARYCASDDAAVEAIGRLFPGRRTVGLSASDMLKRVRGSVE